MKPEEGPFAGLRWEVLRTPPASGAWNMALDEALARERKGDAAFLRLYRWARPTLSFGRNQDPRSRYDPHALHSLGVEAVRRPTGGREVLHDRELTYAVVAPFAGPGSLRGLYRQVNEALLAALEALGVPDPALAQSGPEVRPASRAGSPSDPDPALSPTSRSSADPRSPASRPTGGGDPGARTLHPDAGACFGVPAPGEVVAGGGKIVGSAQRRLGNSLLQHGSLLLAPASVSLAALQLPGQRPGHLLGREAPEEGGITLTHLLGQLPPFETLSSTVEAALAGAFGGSWARAPAPSHRVLDRARHLEAGYADPETVWGPSGGSPSGAMA